MMKQGPKQPFSDFVRKYEMKLLQCEGNTWIPLMKIVHLNNGLNNTLEKALIGIDMPSLDNYIRWRDKVKEVAERLESHQSRSQLTNNTSFQPQNININTNVKDANEDTIMTGMNALLAMLGKSGLNNDNIGSSKSPEKGKGINETRPRAPWRSHAEYQKLRQDRLCVRCKRAGHISKFCSKFRAAVPPEVDLNATLLAEENVDDIGSGKGNP